MKGFILTGGNIFSHSNVEVFIQTINFTGSTKKLLFVKTAEQFVELDGFLKNQEFIFKLHNNGMLPEGKGYFPISFHILKGNVEDFIRKDKSVSGFVLTD